LAVIPVEAELKLADHDQSASAQMTRRSDVKNITQRVKKLPKWTPVVLFLWRLKGKSKFISIILLLTFFCLAKRNANLFFD